MAVAGGVIKPSYSSLAANKRPRPYKAVHKGLRFTPEVLHANPQTIRFSRPLRRADWRGSIFDKLRARAKHVKQDSIPRKEIITSVPEVVSCLGSIKVLNKKIRGDQDAVVVVEVENTSELAIIAISMESSSSDGRATYSVIPTTFEADEPLAIIKPHATYTLTMPVSNVFPHMPLQIGSVTYIDGTDEGCDASLKGMRDTRAMEEAKKAKRKEPHQ
jgi:hypothetical protein